MYLNTAYSQVNSDKYLNLAIGKWGGAVFEKMCATTQKT